MNRPGVSFVIWSKHPQPKTSPFQSCLFSHRNEIITGISCLAIGASCSAIRCLLVKWYQRLWGLEASSSSRMDAGYRTGFYRNGCIEFNVSGREPLSKYSVNAIILILLSACARNIMLLRRDLIDLFLENQSDKKTSRVSYFVWFWRRSVIEILI